MGLCNQILHPCQRIPEEAAVAQPTQDLKGPVQDQNGVLHRSRPQDHDQETFIGSQGGVSVFGNTRQAESFQERDRLGLRHPRGKRLVVLGDQGDVAPDREVRQERNLRGDRSQAGPIDRREDCQGLVESFFTVEEIQMNRTINDSTSMMTIDKKTLTMPLRTEIGILVNSREALMPSRIGITVMKKPKKAHLTIRTRMS